MILDKWRRLISSAHNELAEATVLTIPAWVSSGPWTGSNTLGNVVGYAPDATNRQTILKMDEWGPPEMWTISLGITYDDWGSLVFPAVAACDIIAEIDFGCGGSTQTVEMSWLNGASISLPMNAVSVKARYASTAFFGELNPPPNLRLSAQIARGSKPSTAFLALSPYDGTLLAAPPAITRWNIPAFATQFKCLPLNNNPDPVAAAPFYSPTNKVYINAGTEDADSLAMVQYPVAQVFERWIDIPPFAHSIAYVDTAGTDPAYHMLFKIGT